MKITSAQAHEFLKQQGDSISHVSVHGEPSIVCMADIRDYVVGLEQKLIRLAIALADKLPPA